DPLGPPPGPQADRRPARTAAPADRYAFLVGVQDYRRPTKDTIGSRKDVQFVRQSLLDAGWLPGNIRVVVDGQASGAAVREGMRWLAGKSVPGTFAFFHYSGHVKQFGGGSEALWPVDRDFVRDAEVTRLLSPAQGRVWVDIAGCEAGSFLPGLPSDRVLVTTSSKASEKSYEYPEWGMSVWTGLLFDLAVVQGQADADADGRTTMGEALRYSTYYAQRITLRQEPHGRQTPQTAGDPVRGWTLADPPA
ncbi:MAG: peptidase caspase catalytic subunit p20, partial [Frankiales bacterium]|nr:peptidase caspase catalytic subunit p20 [Frankiales bacterium]